MLAGIAVMEAQRLDIGDDELCPLARSHDLRHGRDVTPWENILPCPGIGHARLAHAADRVQQHHAVLLQQAAAFAEEGPVMRRSDMFEPADGKDTVEIGTADGRERVWLYVYISEVAGN